MLGKIARLCVTVAALTAVVQVHAASDIVQMRRLTEQQYRQSIADIFGADITVVGRFEPDLRSDGLLAIGASQGTVTASGLEQFTSMARSIASQTLSAARRETSVPCKPKNAAKPDDKCASQYVAGIGERLFRRALTPAELNGWTGIAAATARSSGSFYTGLEFTLAGMLVAPEFLFRIDTVEPDPSHAGKERLTANSKAARLSFLLWNTTPDAELLAAAANGELHEPQGLGKQVDRLLASSARLENGVKAFFADSLQLETFATLEKDKLIYPAFDDDAAADAKEQLLRLIADHLLTQGGDYRDIFTTRRTFMTRRLGLLYAVPVQASEGWEAFEFPEGDPRAGLLSHVGFTAAHSHPGRSSATLRGVAIRQLLMCHRVPPAPAAVNFTVVQDTDNPQFKTARERLSAHRTDAACAGCHKVFDPIGLALENFDGVGQWRTLENGAPIDGSGELDRVPFNNQVQLGQAMHDHPAVVSCLVNSTYKYAAGRTPKPAERAWLGSAEKSFTSAGFKFLELLRIIATSEPFLAAPAAAPANVTAQAAAKE